MEKTQNIEELSPIRLEKYIGHLECCLAEHANPGGEEETSILVEMEKCKEMLKKKQPLRSTLKEIHFAAGLLSKYTDSLLNEKLTFEEESQITEKTISSLAKLMELRSKIL